MNIHHHTPRRLMALLLALVLCVGMMPSAFAAQEDNYHDPAEHWIEALNRTNELDANSTVTIETFNCCECGQATSFQVFRVPEYTRNGETALTQHSVDLLLTDPPYGTTRNFWDVPLPLPELWEAVRWAVKPNGAILFFAQCPYDKILGASNLKMLRYEWVWYKSRCTGFLNARRAPLKKTENILVFYQKLPLYQPQFEQGKPYGTSARRARSAPTTANISPVGTVPRTGGGSLEMCWPLRLSSTPSTPRKSRWSCASILSALTPGPASWWRTSARAPARRRWPPSTRAAGTSALKRPQLSSPLLTSASARRGRPWRGAKKECEPSNNIP